ncbi:MAG: alpha/beta fold hydrolase [Bacteroidota bacterium]
MQILKKILITLFILLIALYVGISYTLSNRVLTPESSMERTLNDIPIYWNTTFEEMMSLLPKPEELTLQGYEEIPLHGQYFNVSDSAQCLFIFSHGWGRNWPNMLKYVPMVEDCRCDILMYDHRVHGGSGGKYPTGGIKESKDLIAVTEWANENKGYQWDQMAWFGSSWGGATVLTAGAEDQNVAFIVADSPFQDWYSAIFERAIEDYGSGIAFIAPGVMQVVNLRAGVDYKEANALEKTKEIVEPVLLIHSKGDPETNSVQSVNISKNLNEKSVFHHTHWGNKHVMDVVNNTNEMRKILMDFIRENHIEAFIPIKSVADTLGTQM